MNINPRDPETFAQLQRDRRTSRLDQWRHAGGTRTGAERYLLAILARDQTLNDVQRRDIAEEAARALAGMR
jgi:hypothetical protein